MSEHAAKAGGLTYEQTGVNYADMDPFKIAAQRAAASTAGNLALFGYAEVAASRGESAYVWDEGDRYGAMVASGRAVAYLRGTLGYDKKIQDDQGHKHTAYRQIENPLLVYRGNPKKQFGHNDVTGKDSGHYAFGTLRIDKEGQPHVRLHKMGDDSVRFIPSDLEQTVGSVQFEKTAKGIIVRSRSRRARRHAACRGRRVSQECQDLCPAQSCLFAAGCQ